jgi:leucyl aminopeptidase
MQLTLARIVEESGTITTKTLDQAAHAILLLAPETSIAALPHGKLLEDRLKATHIKKLEPGTPFLTQLPNPAGTRLALLRLEDKQSTFELLTLGRETLAGLRPPAIQKLHVLCVDLAPELAGRATEALVAAALAADFQLPSFKSKPEKPERLVSVHIYGHRSKDGYRHTLAAARGNNLARWFTSLPPNELTPRRYRDQVLKLARAQRWKTEFLDTRKLKALGAGAFLAVAQGSPQPDAGIVHLRYEPKKKSRQPAIALVGKGICFDTGGTNLKPARHMFGMHEDMEGSAVALGTLLALSELKVDHPVDCWLALAQNHIGPNAYKQNDVVKAANGTTIEIVHTDAEGRMVLADTLTLATRRKPGLVLDFATLTGACVGALSTRLSGAVTNRFDYVPPIIAAGIESGERVWPFPLEKDFDKALKSDIADVKQCTPDSEADQILAASFLKRFIEHDTPWVHVDLSAGNHKGGLAHIPSDVTGFGVRFALRLLETVRPE